MTSKQQGNNSLSPKRSVDDPTRRSFLNKLSVILGGTVASQLLTGQGISTALAYTPQMASELKAGKVFTQAEMLTLKSVCAIVIPKTDTLGADEVDTHGFVDNQLFHCHSKQEQQLGKKIILRINQEALNRHQQAYNLCTQQQQYAILDDLEKLQSGFTAQDKQAFKKIKPLIVFGYFTSEEGATKALIYQAIPGGYNGSVPYSSIGKGWGSLAFYW